MQRDKKQTNTEEKSVVQESIAQLISLEETIQSLVNHHLKVVGTSNVRDLHQMLLEQIEPPMLEAVMKHCKYNQTSAAKILGLSRVTLRTMLFKYFDSKYCSQRKTEDNP